MVVETLRLAELDFACTRSDLADEAQLLLLLIVLKDESTDASMKQCSQNCDLRTRATAGDSKSTP